MDCGARHSAILLRDGTILTSGDKKSGKLGRYGKEDKHSSGNISVFLFVLSKYAWTMLTKSK